MVVTLPRQHRCSVVYGLTPLMCGTGCVLPWTTGAKTRQVLQARDVSRSGGPSSDRKYMRAAILDPPSWILVMFQLKIISF